LDGCDAPAYASWTMPSHGIKMLSDRLGFVSEALRRAFFFYAMCASIASCKPAAVEPTRDSASKKEIGVDVELSAGAFDAARLATSVVSMLPRATTVVAIGSLDFAQSKVARIGPLLEGRMVSLNVKTGDHVRAGAVLATMESLDIGRTRADYLGALARRERADIELSREKQLMVQKLTTERDLVEAETERKLADLGVRAASERLHAVGIDARGIGSSAKAMAPSTTVSLTTPVAGEVMEALARVGQPVRASDTLFVVGSIDELWLEIDLYERDLNRVHDGDAARIVAVSFPGRVFEGRVDHIHAVIDREKRVVRVRIVLPNPDGLLRPGMSATARISAEAKSLAGDAGDAAIAVIPRSAIQSIDGQPFVFVQKRAGAYELRAVEKGVEYEALVEIVRGLSERETIVVDGAFILKSEVLREQMGKND
jgi:membrane fusion protein, heavy metal efflux system